MLYIWSSTLLIGVTLQILVVAALLRRGWRRFKGLFAYMVVLLLTTVIEAAAFYSQDIYSRMSGYYWVNDAVRQVLIFFLVIALIQAGLTSGPGRRMGGGLLAAGVVALSLLSLYATRGAIFELWMTEFARDLGFIAVILNLALWAVLLQSRLADRTLLMISGGMGIQMAGKAIGHAVRQLTRPLMAPGDLIIVLTHLFCLYVWWQALRLPPPERDSQLS
jgi:hypothetical protein